MASPSRRVATQIPRVLEQGPAIWSGKLCSVKKNSFHMGFGSCGARFSLIETALRSHFVSMEDRGHICTQINDLLPGSGSPGGMMDGCGGWGWGGRESSCDSLSLFSSSSSFSCLCVCACSRDVYMGCTCHFAYVEVIGQLCVAFFSLLPSFHEFQALNSGLLACAASDFLLNCLPGSGHYCS